MTLLVLTLMLLAAASADPVMQCASDLGRMLNLSYPNSVQMIDAWGKFPPAGLLQGDFQSPGAYWECQSLGYDIARYCSIRNAGFPKTKIHFDVTQIPQLLKLDLPLLLAQLGLCVPASCNQDTLLPALNSSSSLIQIAAVNGSLIVSCDGAKPLSTQASSVIGVLGIFGLAGIAASVVFEYRRLSGDSGNDKKEKKALTDVEEPLLNNAPDNNRLEENNAIERSVNDNNDRPMPRPKKSMAERLVEAFAVTENLRKLFTVSPGSPALDKLRSLDGIRVLSLLWVILGHTYMFFSYTSVNLLQLQAKLQAFSFLFVLNAYFSVDTFFFLSGFLASLLLLMEMQKGVVFTAARIGYVYFHRIWRITPTYFLVVMFLTYVMQFTGSGPGWEGVVGQFSGSCPTTWWRDILYINNFYPMAEDCIGWAWYLANDMQFFIVAPLLTLLIFKLPKYGIGATGLLWLGSVLYCFIESMKYNYPALSLAGDGAAAGVPQNDAHAYITVIYIKPWARIQPYLIGILAAYIHLKHGAKLANKKTLGSVMIITSAAILFLCIFVVHPEQVGEKWSTFGNAIYISLSRSLWAVGLSAILLACCNGIGSIVNDFLSASFWTPFARIGLSAYLIHFLFILWAFGSSQTSMFFSDGSVVTLFLGMVMMTYGFGFLVGAFVEAPLRNLGKILFG